MEPYMEDCHKLKMIEYSDRITRNIFISHALAWVTILVSGTGITFILMN